MLEGLAIGDVKGAEPHIVPHSGYDLSCCADYLNCSLFLVQLKITGPEEQRILRDAETVNKTGPQAFPFEDQLSHKGFCVPACRQRPIMPGEVDLDSSGLTGDFNITIMMT